MLRGLFVILGVDSIRPGEAVVCFTRIVTIVFILQYLRFKDGILCSIMRFRSMPIVNPKSLSHTKNRTAIKHLIDTTCYGQETSTMMYYCLF